MKYISLFSGIGGFDIGFDRAGMECVAQVEKDEKAREVLARHWPAVQKFEDVKDVGRHNLPAADIVCGGSPCFPAGTLVLTSTGYLPIEEIREGMLVLTHMKRWRRVVQTMSRISPTIKLVGRGSNGVQTTTEHPFYNRKQTFTYPRENGKHRRIAHYSGPEWTPAGQMQGRFWASPVGVPECEVPSLEPQMSEKVPCEFSEAFFWFVGAWLGDGWIRRTKRSGRRTTRTSDQVLLCASHSEADSVELRIKAAGLTASRVVARTVVKFVVCSKALARWLSTHFGEKAHGKHVPAWALGMRMEYRKALLAGYFAADGHDYGNSWKATTISKRLGHSIKLLGQSAGYTSAVWRYKVSPKTQIEGRTVNQHEQWQVACYREKKTQFEQDGFIWGRVREVTDGPTCEVFNIGVDEDESYIADGYVVHNCQDLSVAGRRAGLAGERSGLWFEFHRIITELRPQWVVFENVPGLFSSHAGRDFAVILAGLTGIVPGVPKGGWRNAGFIRGRPGYYHAAWRVLDAQGFRVAQRRRRVFIVANLTTLGGGCAEVLLERASSTGDPAPRRETGQDIAATVTARTRKGGFTDPVSDGLIATGYGETGHGYWQPGIQSLRARSMDDANVVAFDWQAGGGGDDTSFRGKSRSYIVRKGDYAQLRANAHDAVCITDQRRVLAADFRNGQVDEIAHTLQAKATGGYSLNYTPGVIAFTERTRADGRNFEMQEDIAYALTNPGSGGRTHSRQIAGDFGVRRLTPTEAARLQGFPDDWNAWLSDSARYRQFGNAVAVPVAEWIGRRIMQVAAGRMPGEDSE